MFKSLLISSMVALTLGLTACSDKNDTSVSIPTSDASAISASAIDSMQTLTTNDGAVNITLTQGNFVDQSDQANSLVDADAVDSLTLLQRDDNQDITLSVNSLGKPQLKADEYFKKLTASLKENKQLTDLKIGMATSNRMNYKFSHKVGQNTMNEECVALYNTDNLSVVCASSATISGPALSATLKNITFQN